jgi:hypothetical protein
MRSHPGDIFEAAVDDANILRDMDVPEDYAAETARRPAK